jgi:hypothetical protein
MINFYSATLFFGADDCFHNNWSDPDQKFISSKLFWIRVDPDPAPQRCVMLFLTELWIFE